MAQNARAHIAAFLFLAAALVIYFFPAIKAGALSAFDYNYAYPPFETIEPREIGNPLLSDQAIGGDAQKYYIGRSLREGRVPFWNPYIGLGTPFLAGGQSAVLFPPNLLFAVLPFGPASIAVAVIKLLLAGTGMYFLVWALLKNHLAALFAGVAFTFCGFNIVWLGHPHTNVSIWLPWLLLFTWQFFETKRRLYLLPYALVVAIQFFGGHIETSLHILSLTALLAIVLTFAKKVWLSFFLFVAASILGFLLAAPQLFPFIEYLLNSWTLVYRSAQVRTRYIPLPWLVPSIFPNIFGNPTWHSYWVHQPGAFNYNETVTGFPGTLSLLLAPLALFSKKWRRWGLGIILLIAAIILGLLGVPPFFTFLSKVPPFSWTLNKRLLLITSFLLVVLAAMALDWLVDLRASDFRRLWEKGRNWVGIHRRALFLGATALAVLLAVVLLSLFPEIRALGIKVAGKLTLNFQKGPKQAFLEFGFVFAAFIILAALKLKNLIGSKLLLVFIVIIALLNGFLYSWNYNPPFAGELFATTPEIEYVQQNAGYDRALIFGRGSLATIYEIYDPHNSDSLVYYPVYQFMDLAEAKNRLRELEVTFENKRFLDFLNVRYFAFQKEKEEDLHFAFEKGKEVDLPGLEKAFEGSSVDIYRNNNALARTFTVEKVIKVGSANEALKLLGSENSDLKNTVTVEGADDIEFEGLSQGRVSIQSLEPERVSLEASCPGACFVVMTDTNYPGWKAKVDGEETKIYKTDVAFRGVYIPEEGTHTVEFDFVPYSFWIGAVTSVLALMALLGLAFARLKFSSDCGGNQVSRDYKKPKGKGAHDCKGCWYNCAQKEDQTCFSHPSTIGSDGGQKTNYPGDGVNSYNSWEKGEIDYGERANEEEEREADYYPA